MAAYAYKRARGTTGLIIGMCLLMPVIMMGMVFLTRGPVPEGLKIAAFSLPPVLMFLIGWMFCRSIHRRRKEGLAVPMKTVGLLVILKPTDAEKAALWSKVGHLAKLLNLTGGAENIQWLTTHDQSHEPETGLGIPLLFEFEWVTGSSRARSTQVHTRTIVAWPSAGLAQAEAPLEGDGERFLMVRRDRIERSHARAEALQKHPYTDLSIQWNIYGSPAIGDLFLTPQILAELHSSPRGEEWAFSSGWVCCVLKHPLDGMNLARFYRRADSMVKELRPGV